MHEDEDEHVVQDDEDPKDPKGGVSAPMERRRGSVTYKHDDEDEHVVQGNDDPPRPLCHQ